MGHATELWPTNVVGRHSFPLFAIDCRGKPKKYTYSTRTSQSLFEKSYKRRSDGLSLGLRSVKRLTTWKVSHNKILAKHTISNLFSGHFLAYGGFDDDDDGTMMKCLTKYLTFDAIFSKKKLTTPKPREHKTLN